MRVVFALLTGLAVAACGADGEPVQPTANTSLNVSPSGVTLGTNVRVGQGPFAVNLGLRL